jgi:hypothetical protein
MAPRERQQAHASGVGSLLALSCMLMRCQQLQAQAAAACREDMTLGRFVAMILACWEQLEVQWKMIWLIWRMLPAAWQLLICNPWVSAPKERCKITQYVPSKKNNKNQTEDHHVDCTD